MYRLGAVSLKRLKEVHPDLVRVVVLAIERSPYDFTVTEGLRTLERQHELVAKKLSQTLKSKHLKHADGFAHAVDVMAVGDLNKDGIADAQDKSWTWKPEVYREIANAMQTAAKDLGVQIRWGGEFKTRDGKPFFDGPHFELV